MQCLNIRKILDILFASKPTLGFEQYYVAWEKWIKIVCSYVLLLYIMIL